MLQRPFHDQSKFRRLEALGVVDPHLEVFRKQVLQACSIVRICIRFLAGKVLLLPVKRNAEVAGNLEQPVRKLVMILELTKLFVGFDKSVLTYVKRIFSITGQAEAVAEN